MLIKSLRPSMNSGFLLHFNVSLNNNPLVKYKQIDNDYLSMSEINHFLRYKTRYNDIQIIFFGEKLKKNGHTSHPG